MDNLIPGSIWKYKESYVQSTNKYYAWSKLTSLKRAKMHLRSLRFTVMEVVTTYSGEKLVKFSMDGILSQKMLGFFLNNMEPADDEEQSLTLFRFDKVEEPL